MTIQFGGRFYLDTSAYTDQRATEMSRKFNDATRPGAIQYGYGVNGVIGVDVAYVKDSEDAATLQRLQDADLSFRYEYDSKKPIRADELKFWMGEGERLSIFQIVKSWFTED